MKKEWLEQYTERRYGASSEVASRAWEFLLAGPYRAGTNGVESGSIICARTGKARTLLTEGDEVMVARRMLDKYKQIAKEYYDVEKTN